MQDFNEIRGKYTLKELGDSLALFYLKLEKKYKKRGTKPNK